MLQNLGLESQEDLFDFDDDDKLVIAANLEDDEEPPIIPPTPQQARAKRRRVVIEADQEHGEPGVLEENGEDVVSRYFKTSEGQFDIQKYGKVKANKKAKIMANIMNCICIVHNKIFTVIYLHTSFFHIYLIT